MGKNFLENYLNEKLILNSEEIQRALTHSSFDASNYEQLEFLGDAVLGFVISEFLYKKMSDIKVGEIAKVKSYLVSKEVLFRIGAKYKIVDLLRVGQALKISEIKKNKKIISDAMEAIVGAIYIKSGLPEAKDFIFEIYKDELKNLKQKKDFNDYKSKLQIISLERYNFLPEYNLIKTEGKEHRKIFYVNVTVIGKYSGRGKGTTIKEAEQMAAKDCIKKIK